MIPVLIGLAAQIGAPVIKGILTRKLGAQNGALIGGIVDQIAARAGVPVEGLATMVDEAPGRVIEAIREVEVAAPEMLAAHEAAMQHQIDLMQAEMSAGGPLWTWGWRPAGMWGLGALWFWNLVFLHVANAVWKIALPQADLGILFQLTVVYMGLYMGGHTVKDFVAAKWGSK